MDKYRETPGEVLRCKTAESSAKEPGMSILMCGYGGVITFTGRSSRRGIAEFVQIFADMYPSSPIEKILEYVDLVDDNRSEEMKLKGYSIKPAHFDNPVEVWDLSGGRTDRDHHFTGYGLVDSNPLRFFLRKKSVIMLCDSIVDDAGFTDLQRNWLPSLDDKTPRFLLESDYMESGWSLEDNWIKENIKRRRPNESELAQKELDCIRRFFCSHKDEKCVQEIFLYMLDYLENIAPKGE